MKLGAMATDTQEADAALTIVPSFSTYFGACYERGLCICISIEADKAY